MTGIIDMRLMRYINLFERISGVSTKNCFIYNNIIIFAVPKKLISRAVGNKGENVRRIGEIFRKKIKIIPLSEDIGRFVEDVVEPISFNKIEVRDGVVTISAGRQSKAALIGRNRTREQELGEVLKNFFGVQRLRIM